MAHEREFYPDPFEHVRGTSQDPILEHDGTCLPGAREAVIAMAPPAYRKAKKKIGVVSGRQQSGTSR